MNTKTVLSIKVDKDIKEKAQKLAKAMGLNLSQIANASYKQFVRNREFTFTDGYTMTPYLEKVIEEAQAEYDRGESIGPFTGDELISYLKKI